MVVLHCLGAGTTNPGGTRKLNNTLKGIRNTIPQDLDNPLKGIRDLVKKRNPEPVSKRVNSKRTTIKGLVAVKRDANDG